jgi:HK97 family phage prohead protease
MLGFVARIKRAFRGPVFDARAGGGMTDPQETRDISAVAPLLRLAPPLETRFIGEDAAQGIISGYASVWAGQPGGEVDSYGDQIARNAFSATLAEHKAAGTMPPMLWSHDPSRPVGKWVEVREDDRGLFVVGQLNLQTDAGKEAFAHLQARDVSGLSIGFQVAKDGFQHQTGGSRLLTAVSLFEISVVAMPASRAARITEVKSMQTQRDLERWLHDEAGLSRAAAVKVARGGWSALSGEPADEEKFAPLARRIEAALTEMRALKSANRYS